MNGTIRYTIRPYDTIWMLAQVFNTTVDDIMQLNPGIDPRNLQNGQVVNIRPGYQYYPSYNGNMNETIDDINADDMMGQDMMDEDMMDEDMMNDEMMNQDMCDLNNYFRMLWEQHVHWTTLAILGIIHNLPESDQILQRLLRNPVDFANAFAPFYGEEAAGRLEELLTAHLTIAAEVVRAAVAGDNNALTEADARWRQNADDIAAFLGDINRNWSVEDWEAMLNEHLDILTAFVEAMIAGKYDQAILVADNMEAQALEMADMMSSGVSEQFPG